MKLRCWIFGHDWLFHVRPFSASHITYTQKVCRRCKKVGPWYMGVDLGGVPKYEMVDGQRVIKDIDIYEFSVVRESDGEFTTNAKKYFDPEYAKKVIEAMDTPVPNIIELEGVTVEIVRNEEEE